MIATERANVLRNALRAAFPHTVPILAGFWFLGMAYGIYMNVSGFSVWYTLLMTILIFGGSLEFVAVSMLLSPFAPWSAFLMALMIQARHLFYGLSMLEKYKGLGAKRWYLIYGLCDETFSINCSAKVPAQVDRGWYYFFVTLLNQFYWISGAVLGTLLGALLSFDMRGLEFVLTAMFVVIFLEQCLHEKQHITAIIGITATAACRLCFGESAFIVPAMLVILTLLTLLRHPITKAGDWS